MAPLIIKKMPLFGADLKILWMSSLNKRPKKAAGRVPIIKKRISFLEVANRLILERFPELRQQKGSSGFFFHIFDAGGTGFPPVVVIINNYISDFFDEFLSFFNIIVFYVNGFIND